MFSMAPTTTPFIQKRPSFITLTSISFWLYAGLVLVFMLILLFSSALREQFTYYWKNSEWAILLLGVLAIYLTVSAIGLWRFKKWGVLLGIFCPFVLVLISIAGIVKTFIDGTFTNWEIIFTYIFILTGSVGWASEFSKFWKQINR